MKKILYILLISLFVCSNVFAVEFMSTDPRKTMNAYTIVNTGSGGYGANDGILITAVSTSTIVPGTHRIIGYEITYLDSSLNIEATITLADTTAALFKATAVNTAPTGQFAESEAISGQALYRIFPYPRSIGTQLIVRQGQNTVVTIFYDVR